MKSVVISIYSKNMSQLDLNYTKDEYKKSCTVGKQPL